MKIPDVDLRTFNVLSLCSGVGGLELGLGLAVANARTVCYVEREAYCCAVLVKRMGEGQLDQAPVWTDLSTFAGEPWRGVVDCITAGYPCQPFSVVGKRKGTGDHRHAWPEVARVVREVDPGWCFFENVGRHLRVGFERVHKDLREMGYRVAAGVFTSEEVGAPHRRERLFIVGRKGTGKGEEGNVGHPPGQCRVQPHGNPGGTEYDHPGPASDEETVAEDQLPVWPPGPDDEEGWLRTVRSHPDLTPGFPTECGGLRVPDGLAHRLDRRRAAGNGVVPLVAAYAWRTLTVALDHTAT